MQTPGTPCRSGSTAGLLLADYSGRDLFRAKLVLHQGIWIAETIAWWRPKNKAAQK